MKVNEGRGENNDLSVLYMSVTFESHALEDDPRKPVAGSEVRKPLQPLAFTASNMHVAVLIIVQNADVTRNVQRLHR